MWCCTVRLAMIFLSTLSLRRATIYRGDHVDLLYISIHALLAESDAQTRRKAALYGYFYPRSPCGERHSLNVASQSCTKFLSTLSLRRATQRLRLSALLSVFLSTLSLRRATTVADLGKRDIGFLSTLSLRRATSYSPRWLFSSNISIHALLAESDYRHCRTESRTLLFLSTLSLRRATSRPTLGKAAQPISIHALLAESDEISLIRPYAYLAFLSTLSLRRATDRVCRRRWRIPYFYPRSPCGERQSDTCR